MKDFFLFLCFVICCKSSFAQSFVNPEGYYELIGKVKVDKNGDVWGRNGNMQVKMLKEKKVVVMIFGSRGMPSYNMGELMDTVVYKKNTVVCSSEHDSTCKITIHFTKNKAEVNHDANAYCGFGAFVSVDGVYKKKRKKCPNIVSQITGTVIEQ